MSGFHVQNEQLFAENVSLETIAQTYGTPSYVYSASYIQERVTGLQDVLAKTLPAETDLLIAFACKSNTSMAILNIMAELGLGSDIVSGGEMIRSLNAGIAADKIVFSGVGKSDQEILDALNQGILRINVESDIELRRINELAGKAGKNARVVLRYNPNVDANTHAKITTGKSENKFGINHDKLIEVYEWASAQDALTPVGVSMHIGSQLTDIDPFKHAFKKLAGLVTELRNKNLHVEVTDLGGGLGIVYKDETPPSLDAYAKNILDYIIPLGTKIVLEPGRYLMGNAGLLLTKTLYVKKGDTRQYVILDAGMNDLMRPSLYDAYHEIRPVKIDTAASEQDYDIVGPVCETGDTFAKAYKLPELQTGDLVAIMSAGAYGFTMASTYNSRGLPAEILVKDNKHALIRKRQSIQDIMKDEQLPQWTA